MPSRKSLSDQQVSYRRPWFAAFVNLARQAVLENVLCLIGFSGDDPNFLAWTGWVRDQLGEYSPRIYLCGILDLTNAQRTVLQARGVLPIDLAPLFPADEWPDPGERHRQATEWLLKSLRHGRPYDPMEWPNPQPEEPTAPDCKNPPLAGSQAVPKSVPHAPIDGSLPEGTSPAELLTTVAETWEYNRRLYPGWLIAPKDVSDRLIGSRSDGWEKFYLSNRQLLNPHANLKWLHEFNWRLETALVPIWDHLVPVYVQVLEAINPIQKQVINIEKSALSPQAAENSSLDWNAISFQWNSVACGLLRHYREERKWAEFECWADRIVAAALPSSDTLAFLCYQRCLRGLATMDVVMINDGLKDWPTETRDPIWAIRRAGLQAELGHTQEASRLVDVTLAKIRNGLEDTNRHIPALSREGWALRLAHGIEMASISLAGRHNSWQARNWTIRQRFRQLRPFGADPEDLADNLLLRLDQPPPARRSPVRRRVKFEPGRVSQTMFFGDDMLAKLLPAYQFMRLCEESGVPPRIGSVSCHTTPLKQAAVWFRDHDPVRTHSLMFRLLDKHVIDDYLTRHRIAALPSEVVDHWREYCRKAICEALPNAGREIVDGTDGWLHNRERLKAAADLLARTSVRATDPDLIELWDLFVRLYSAEECRIPVGGDDIFRPLLDNLLETSSNEVLAMQIRPLFNLPLPGERGFEVWRPNQWEDPATRVGIKLWKGGWRSLAADWDGVVDRLVTSLDSDTLTVRSIALHRLFTLDQLKLIRQNDYDRIGQAFWRTSQQSDSLPFDRWGQLALNYALVWPSPDGIEPQKRVKKHLLQKELDPVFGFGNSDSWLTDIMRFTDPGRSLPAGQRLHWSSADRLRICDILCSWWSTHGSNQAISYADGKDDPFCGDDAFVSFVVLMWDVVREVLLIQPKLVGRARSLAMQLVNDIKQAGLPVGCVLPAILRIDPSQYNAVASVLRQELTDGRPDYRHSALRGLVFWADAHRRMPSAQPLPAPPIDLLRELGAAVAMRHRSDIHLLLNGVRAILNRHKNSADQQFVENVLVGLDFMFTETQYREREAAIETIAYDDVPSVRVECVRIARVLASAGKAADSRVEKWLDAAAIDVLPEVRRAANEAII